MSFGVNVVTSGLLVLGAGEVVAGLLGVEVTALTGGVLGFGAETEAAFASGMGLVARGAGHMAAGAAPSTLTAVGVAGDVASSNWSWKSLVPVVGLGNAWNAVAATCR